MNTHFKTIIYLAIIILSNIIQANAQSIRQISRNTNAWFMYVGSHKFTDKWGLHLEAQLRRSDIILEAQQLLLRGGLNYHVNSQITITSGYCFVETYPYGKLPVKSKYPENRIWEQLQFKNQLGSIEWISRYRLEQRFLHLPHQTVNGYEANDTVTKSNRARIMNRFSIPFKGKLIEEKSIYLSAYDEVMINFGKQVGLNLFDQNRLYLAIGYRLSKIGRLEVGYLNQTIVKSDGKTIETNNTLQVGLLANIDIYKKNKLK